MKNDRQIKIMGIVNINDESFYSKSRCGNAEATEKRIAEMMEEGADMIDIGGCSTRPGSTPVSQEQEWKYISNSIKLVASSATDMGLSKEKGGSLRYRISVDTFRSEIVRRIYDIMGDFTVNDISSGEDDPDMLATVGELHLPYIAMHKRGNPTDMQQKCDYPYGVVNEVHKYFSDFAEKAGEYGISEYMIDPGFGFAKTIEQNYELMKGMDALLDLGKEILVGISRKTMIWKPLGITPDEALAGTCALNFYSLQKGATVLRVHDVKEAVQMKKIYGQLYF